MKKTVIMILCLVFLTASAQKATANEKELTGIVKLACEAILCLSSGERPGECDPSLSHYFSIWCFDDEGCVDWSCTVDKRLSFLNMCPVVEGNGEMQNLTSSIANGSGYSSIGDRCSAKTLNKKLKKRKWVGKECVRYDETIEGYYYGHNNKTKPCLEWQDIYEEYIDDVMPSYCKQYKDHMYTYEAVTTHYVGQKGKGGKWVD